MKAVVEKDGLARHLFWKGTANVQSAHPLASCRMGDDPATSALDDRHAAALLLRRAAEFGLPARTHVPPPGTTDALRRRRCVHPA